MSSRTYTYCQTLEREVKILYGSFAIGATGAVGTIKGGFTVVRNSAGNYTITYPQHYNRLLFASGGFINSGAGSGIAAVEIKTSPATLQSGFQATASYIIQFYDYAGAAADAASGSVHSFCAHVRNTTISVGND